MQAKRHFFFFAAHSVSVLLREPITASSAAYFTSPVTIEPAIVCRELKRLTSHGMKKRTIRRTALSNTELARVTGGAVPARYYYKQSFGMFVAHSEVNTFCLSPKLRFAIGAIHTKTGTGTATLTAANTYSGTTTVSVPEQHPRWRVRHAFALGVRRALGRHGNALGGGTIVLRI